MDYKVSDRSLAGFKAAVTRQINNCTASTTQRPNHLNVRKNIELLENRWKKYEENSDIYISERESDLDDSEFDRITKNYSDFEDQYQSKLRTFREVLVNLESNSRTSGSSTQGQAEKVKVRMPEIRLKEFSGEIDSWQPFWDSFRSLVHDRSDLDKVVKFTYLSQCLKGEAAEVIGGYQHSDQDYDDAIASLIDNFANENKIKQTLTLQLLRIEEPKNDHESLKKFKNNFERLIKNLSHYQKELKASYWLIAVLLQSKLPPEAEKFIYQKYGTKYFSVEEISHGLTDHIEFLVRMSSSSKVGIQYGKNSRSEQSTMIGTFGVKSQKINGCLLCDEQGHRAKDCAKFNTHEARRDQFKKQGRCFRCLRYHKGKCDKVIQCRICKLNNHLDIFCKRQLNTADKQSSGCGDVAPVLSSPCLGGTNAALATAQVIVMNGRNNKMAQTRCFFDPGSQVSFITTGLASMLDFPVSRKLKLSIKGFMSESVGTYNQVEPTLLLGSRKVKVSTIVTDKLPSTIITPGLSKVKEALVESGIKLADPDLDDKIEDVQLLIGSDFFGEFVNSIHKFKNINLFGTPGGEMIYGPIPGKYRDTVSAGVMVCRVTTSILPSDVSEIAEEGCKVERLWDLESVGIDVDAGNYDDDLAYSRFLESVKFENGQYVVGLPWRLNTPFLPNNYKMALGQLYSLRKNLERTPGHLELYNSIIDDHIKKGFIELVSNAKVGNNTHYLPHHGVAKQSLTTPLRIVHNCSAKSGKGSVSLNDCLLKGPSLINKLCDVLLKFRTNKLAYSADISKAFLRVGLHEEDRDWLRFLWFKDPKDMNSEVVTLRFKVVIFGSTSSPFLLMATIENHLKNSSVEMRNIIFDSFYVDNLIGTTSSEAELRQIYGESNLVMDQAGLPLRMWATNSREVNGLIEKDFEGYTVPQDMGILGLSWNISDDTLSLKKVDLDLPDKINKRKLLSLVSMVFDPLGLFLPVLIRGKLLIQNAWKLKVSWNDNLPQEFLNSWKELRQDFNDLHSIDVPRCIILPNGTWNLHVFADSSIVAYGCAVYLVSMSESNLLMSKAKVAPLKTRTLPQLELTSIWLACKIAIYVIRTLSRFNFENVYIWSDSEISLQWIRNCNSSIIYVKNRVAGIHEISKNFRFLYVPTQDNPADLVTRGVTTEDLRSNKLWSKGPTWLISNDWPEQKEHLDIQVNEISVEPENLVEPIFDCEKYSSLTKILGITSRIFSFLTKFTVIRRKSINFPDAEVYWFSISQLKYYREIFSFMLNKETEIDCFNYLRSSVVLNDRLNLSDKKLCKDLGLYFDPKICLIRSRGRIQNSNASLGSKFPVLVSSKSHITRLFIERAHRLALHEGVSGTLAHIRQEIWVPKGRQAVKSIIGRCVICKRVQGKSCKYPGPPPLPACRTVLDKPFSRIGVDYSGPLMLTGNVDDTPVKVYIALFTCTATRGVHLDIAEDMTAVTFLLLFRKFCATHSVPSLIISDNGTNFRATAKLFEEFSNDPTIIDFCGANKITWKFIAPRAPWQGGFYERLIKTVKNCLQKVLHNRKISLRALRTILVEVQTRVNNRPLTYVDSSSDNLEPLTPNHLICGRRINNFPPLLTSNDDYNPTVNVSGDLRCSFFELSKLIKRFESIWNTEYLSSLRERYYGSSSPTNISSLRVGDVVIVQNEHNRQHWPLGKVLKLHSDSSGIVRSADVFCRGKTTIRTLEKLIPLEVSDSIEVDLPKLNEDPPVRSRRKAAIEASRLRRALIDNDQL